MKKILCIVFIIILQFSLISCENSNKNLENNEKMFTNYFSDTNNIVLHKAETKIYFAENKYVSFEISKDFNVFFENNDIVLFDDNTVMAKLYSNIKISLADSNFIKNYNGIFINSNTNTLIRKISTGTKTWKLEEINLENFKIVNAMQITPIFENYNNIGIAVYFPNDQENDLNFLDININNNLDSLSSNTGTVFYAFLRNTEISQNINKTDFCSNILFEFELHTKENITNININMDILLENKFVVFTIIKVNENNFYYMKMIENDNNEFVLNNSQNPSLINFSLK